MYKYIDIFLTLKVEKLPDTVSDRLVNLWIDVLTHFLNNKKISMHHSGTTVSD